MNHIHNQTHRAQTRFWESRKPSGCLTNLIILTFDFQFRFSTTSCAYTFEIMSKSINDCCLQQWKFDDLVKVFPFGILFYEVSTIHLIFS
jgi:hypothetical protein